MNEDTDMVEIARYLLDFLVKALALVFKPACNLNKMT